MQAFAYVHPENLKEALASLGTAWGETDVLAGGTDLLALMKDNIHAPKTVVSLKGVKELKGIKSSAAGLEIGAMTTVDELMSNAAVRAYPALMQAAAGIASPQIRNMGTVGGDLCQRPRCWYFRSPEFACLKKGGSECFAQKGENAFHAVFGNGTCAIVHPSAAGVALMAYGATVETVSPAGPRSIPIEAFFVRPETDILAENALHPAELIVEVSVPKAAVRSAYRKVKQKQAFDWPLADAAVAWREEGGVAKDVRIVIGSAAPVPWRAKAAEALVEGKKIDAALAAKAGAAALEGATPLGKNAYKLPIVAAAVRRTLLASAGIADGSENA
jgi:xanthine dehydrogenase YagS FAD-binding subunit